MLYFNKDMEKMPPLAYKSLPRNVPLQIFCWCEDELKNLANCKKKGFFSLSFTQHQLQNVKQLYLTVCSL